MDIVSVFVQYSIDKKNILLPDKILYCPTEYSNCELVVSFLWTLFLCLFNILLQNRIFYCPTEYFIARQNILLPIGIFYCPTEYYITQQNILLPNRICYYLTEYSIAKQNILLSNRIFYCPTERTPVDNLGPPSFILYILLKLSTNGCFWVEFWRPFVFFDCKIIV